MIRPPYDGWVDLRGMRQAREGEIVPIASEEQARQSVASFRGEVLAAAYALESSLEILILWHLFRDRQDGMAAFFEDAVLRESGFGLERKVRLTNAIIDYWSDSDQALDDKGRLGRARQIRNQVAHWPARLIPVQRGEDILGFDVQLVKGDKLVLLDGPSRLHIVRDFAEACKRLDELSRELAEFARREDH